MLIIYVHVYKICNNNYHIAEDIGCKNWLFELVGGDNFGELPPKEMWML